MLDLLKQSNNKRKLKWGLQKNNANKRNPINNIVFPRYELDVSEGPFLEKESIKFIKKT